MPAFRSSLIVRSKKAKSSSTAWISRQNRDKYVKLRSASVFRSRSAFKLLEIDAQWGGFLAKPDVRTVVDLGAAPGGWSQVVAARLGWGDELTRSFEGGGYKLLKEREPLRTKDLEKKTDVGDETEKRSKGQRKTLSMLRSEPHDQEKEELIFDPLNIDDALGQIATAQNRAGRGTIIAVDLLRMQPIHGVRTLQADFLSSETEHLIRETLLSDSAPEVKVDIILSDMAANASGNDIRDIEISLEICEAVFEFARNHLRSAESIGRRKGGVLLMKHFTHPLLQRFRVEKLKPHFNEVNYIKPESSRSDSREGYFLCQGWKGTGS